MEVNLAGKLIFKWLPQQFVKKCSTIALRHTHTHADGVKEPYEVLQILINLFVPGKLAKYFIFSGSHSTNFSLSDKCGYFLASERISPCPPVLISQKLTSVACIRTIWLSFKISIDLRLFEA